MLRRSPSSMASLALLLALATASELTTSHIPQAVAQSPAPFPVPTVVPADTTVRIDMSPSLSAISKTLKQKFESQYPGTQVRLDEKTTENALKALQEGKVDLAAIGRTLTDAEKAAGLVQVPISRRKIAIVVGQDNPVSDMTGEQFSDIFRGKIVNWSEVGGANEPIRFVDRPNSDTRQALQPYPVFQAAPFQTGASADPVERENVDAMIRKLGRDGISYALIDQVDNKRGVKIVSLYGTLPSDPSYPFSQPLTYVYRADNVTPAVRLFLGHVASPDVQQALAAVPTAPAPAAPAAPAVTPPANTAPTVTAKAPDTDYPASPRPSPQVNAATGASPGAATGTATGTATGASPGANPGAIAQAPTANVGADAGASRGLPWWLGPLLAIPLLGGLLWLLSRGGSTSAADPARSASAPVATATLAADRAGENSRIILAPRGPNQAYAYWEVPEAHKQRVRKDEGGDKLALRLYDVTGREFERHPANSIQQFDCDEAAQDLHIPIPENDRDYLVELGYVTYQGRWVKLAQSNAVRVPGGEGSEPFSEPPEYYRADEQITASSVESPAISPTPTLPRFGESFQAGGMDVTDPMTNRIETESFPLKTDTTDTVSFPDSAGLPLAGTAALGGAMAAGAALTGSAATGTSPAALTGTPIVDDSRTQRVRRSRIVLVPHDAQNAYAYWEVLDQHKDLAKQHGGQSFILRICDVTGVTDQQSPHSIQQFNCEETDSDRHVTVPDMGDYVAEIGYLAKNGRWLRIARSEPTHIPALEPPISIPFP